MGNYPPVNGLDYISPELKKPLNPKSFNLNPKAPLQEEPSRNPKHPKLRL